MSPLRRDKSAFNPEKFLLKEKKAAGPTKIDPGNFLTLTFSKAHLLRFLPRVAAEFPAAFYIGPEQAKTEAVFSIWSREVAKELGMWGIGPDPKLIHLLVASIVLSPEWKRLARRVNRIVGNDGSKR